MTKTKKLKEKQVWSEVPNNSHIAVFLSVLPPILGAPPFPPEEFLESLCGISQASCEFILLAVLKFLFSLFSLQRPTEGHTTAGCHLAQISVPRLPLPGVKLLMFVPVMLLLATAEAADSKAVDI